MLELLLSQDTKRDGSFLESGAFLVSLLGALGSIVVTNVGVKSYEIPAC